MRQWKQTVLPFFVVISSLLARLFNSWKKKSLWTFISHVFFCYLKVYISRIRVNNWDCCCCCCCWDSERELILKKGRGKLVLYFYVLFFTKYSHFDVLKRERLSLCWISSPKQINRNVKELFDWEKVKILDFKQEIWGYVAQF